MDNGTLRQFAADIAAHLGDDWQLVPVVGGNEFEQRAPHIRQGADGPEFYLHGTWSGKGRLYVAGNYPKDAEGREQRPYFSTYSENGTASPSITFADTKTPALAAKDIARRFLPAYIPLWQKQAAQVRSSMDYAAKRAAFAVVVARLLGGEVKKDNNGLSSVRLGYHAQGISGEIDLDHDTETVGVSLRGVTLTQLQQLQQLMTGDPA